MEGGSCLEGFSATDVFSEETAWMSWYGSLHFAILGRSLICLIMLLLLIRGPSTHRTKRLFLRISRLPPVDPCSHVLVRFFGQLIKQQLSLNILSISHPRTSVNGTSITSLLLLLDSLTSYPSLQTHILAIPLPLYRSNQPPRMLGRAELEQPDALPGPI